MHACRSTLEDPTGGGASSQTGVACETRAAVGGPAGSVSVRSPCVEIVDEGEITSLTKGTGGAGAITLRAGSLLIDGRDAPLLTGLQGRVGEGEGDVGAAGPGGTIRVSAGRIDLRRGGVITSSTFGSGPGGAVRVTSAGAVRVAGSARSAFTGIFSQSLPVAGLGDPGPGGDVALRAGSLRVTGASPAAGGAATLSGISTRSTGTGAAGRADVRAGVIGVSDGGAITVQADAGRAGTLTVAAARDATVRGATVSAAGLTGGNVSLRAGDLLAIDRGTVTARAGSAGGRVTLGQPSAAVFLDGGTIDARSGGTPVRIRIDGQFLRRGGVILTNTPQSFPTVDLTGSLLALPAAVPSSLRPLPDVCGARLGAELSTFVVTGAGGTPPQPGGWSPDGPEEADWKLMLKGSGSQEGSTPRAAPF